MQIYAMDVLKEYLDVFSVDENQKSFSKKIKNSFSSICKFLSSVDSEDVLCAEYTGVYTSLLAHLTAGFEIKFALASGFDIKHSLGNRKGKSDTLDAQRIWEYANRFHDKLVFHVPESETMQELKALFSLLNQLVKNLKMLSTAHTMEKQNPYLSIAESSLRMETESFLKQQILKTEQQISLLIGTSEELSQTFHLITSITGIGKVTAWELIISTGNFKKIASARKAAAYAGVCPYPNQSGNTAKKAGIHFRADKKLKSLLYLCSTTICTHNKEFLLYGQRKMMEGKHFYLVMNNVANKLLRTVYAVVQSKVPFIPLLITPDPRFSKSNN